MSMLKLKKGDTVYVATGKDLGKKAKILQVVPTKGHALVEGINMVSRHQKPKSASKPGEILKKESPMSLAKLMLVCPSCQKHVRVGFSAKDGGQKTRICKGCGEQIDK
jgi:large subunit ribosomal protein L24